MADSEAKSEEVTVRSLSKPSGHKKTDSSLGGLLPSLGLGCEIVDAAGKTDETSVVAAKAAVSTPTASSSAASSSSPSGATRSGGSKVTSPSGSATMEYISPSKSLSKTMYSINMTCARNGCEWKILKRYSDFDALHSALEGDIEFRGIRVPILPGKSFTLFESAKKDLIQSRKRDLQEYLSQLIQRNVFATSKHLINFLKMPEEVKKLALQLSDALHKPIKDGYLWKKGEYNTKWRRRWFVLHSDHILKYYKNETCASLKGAIDMSTIQKVSTRIRTDSPKKDASKETSREFQVLLKSREREWHLAAETAAEKKEWSKVFLRSKELRAGYLRKPGGLFGGMGSSLASAAVLSAGSSADSSAGSSLMTKGSMVTTGGEDAGYSGAILDLPAASSTLGSSSSTEDIAALGATVRDVVNASLRVRPHTAPVTGISWCPVLPRLVATGGEDNTVKLWCITMATEPAKRQAGEVTLSAVAEWQTTGKVLDLKWSPRGDMLAASLFNGEGSFFVECFDLRSVLKNSSTDHVSGRQTIVDYDGTIAVNEIDEEDDDEEEEDGSAGAAPLSAAASAVAASTVADVTRASALSSTVTATSSHSVSKIFTLEDCAKWIFVGHSRKIYLCMDIDPLSEENLRRKPAFVVCLDLNVNRLFQCKEIVRSINHKAERITAMSMNSTHSLMVVGVCDVTLDTETSGQTRLLAWDVDLDLAVAIDDAAKSGSKSVIKSLSFTDSDGYLLVGRSDGTVQFYRNNNNLGYDEELTDMDDAGSGSSSGIVGGSSSSSIGVGKSDLIQFEKVFDVALSESVDQLSVSGSMMIAVSGKEAVLFDLRPIFNEEAAMPTRIGVVGAAPASTDGLTTISPVLPKHAGLGSLMVTSSKTSLKCAKLTNVILDCLMK